MSFLSINYSRKKLPFPRISKHRPVLMRNTTIYTIVDTEFSEDLPYYTNDGIDLTDIINVYQKHGLHIGSNVAKLLQWTDDQNWQWTGDWTNWEDYLMDDEGGVSQAMSQYRDEIIACLMLS